MTTGERSRGLTHHHLWRHPVNGPQGTLLYPGCTTALTSHEDSRWLKLTALPSWYFHRTTALYRHTSSYCALLHCALHSLLFFYKLKARPSTSKIMTLFPVILMVWKQTPDMHVFTKQSRRQKCLIYWVTPINSGRTGFRDSPPKESGPALLKPGNSKVHFSKAHFTGSQSFIKPRLPFQSRPMWLGFSSLPLCVLCTCP